MGAERASHKRQPARIPDHQVAYKWPLVQPRRRAGVPQRRATDDLPSLWPTQQVQERLEELITMNIALLSQIGQFAAKAQELEVENARLRVEGRSAELESERAQGRQRDTTEKLQAARQLAHDAGSDVLAARMLAQDAPAAVRDDITQCLENLAGFLASIMVGSRPITHGFEQEEIPIIHLSELIREEMRQIQVSYDRHISFTSEPKEVFIQMHPFDIQRIVRNLLKNACEATSDQERIEIQIHDTGKKIRVVVSDEGCGIPAERISGLFDPAAQWTTKPDGHGIGLSSVANVVEDYGGEISVESTVGEGTTFTVDLPAVQ